MRKWGPTLLLFTGATLLLAACAMPAAPSGSPSPLAAPDSPLPAGANRLETPASLPPASLSAGQPVSANGIPGELLNSVLDDAAQRLGAAPDTLVVTRAEATTWSDGSLGCPEPGMFYTQALVDGYWIVVEAGGQTLDYRTQSNGFFRLCERGLPRGGSKP